jgi:hypothetical protein
MAFKIAEKVSEKEKNDVLNALKNVKLGDVEKEINLGTKVGGLVPSYEAFSRAVIKLGARKNVISQWNELTDDEKRVVKAELAKLPQTNKFADSMLKFLDTLNNVEKAKTKFGEAVAAEIPGMVEAPAIPDIIKVEKGITTLGAKDYIRITYNDASGKEKRLDLYGIDLKSWASDSSEVAKALGKIEDNDLRYDYTKFSKETLNVLISEGKIKLDTKTGVLSKA